MFGVADRVRLIPLLPTMKPSVDMGHPKLWQAQGSFCRRAGAAELLRGNVGLDVLCHCVDRGRVYHFLEFGVVFSDLNLQMLAYRLQQL